MSTKTYTEECKVDKAVELIKEFEGFRATAYYCPANVLTIGYGHTATTKNWMIITKAEAEVLLRQDIDYVIPFIEDLVKVKLTENQFNALISFTFNLGVGNLKRSTLLKLINKGDFKNAAKEFNKWTRAGGVVLKGLVKRRAAERALFES